MSDLDFYIPIYGGIAVFWSLIYFLFHRFRKTDKNIFKIVEYWYTCIVSTVLVFIIGLSLFMSEFMSSTVRTSPSVNYGTLIYESSDDYGDYLKLYDNETFHVYCGYEESNGDFKLKKDSIVLIHSKLYDGKNLPSFFINDSMSFYIKGYRKSQSPPDKFQEAMFLSGLVDTSKINEKYNR